MGFYFRKSIKFGPLRVNLSKSGIGVSAGVKGFRVSSGPRGTHLNAGRKGIYYRTKLSGKKSTSHPTSSQQSITTLVIALLALFVIGMIGIASTVSPILGAGLFIIGIIALAAYGILKSPSPAPAQQEPEPSALINLKENPEQATIAALMLCVDNAKVSTDVLCLSLNTSSAEASLLIGKLKELGVVLQKDERLGFEKDLILRDRAYLVATALHVSNFTRRLNELQQPAPHVTLDVKPGALGNEILSLPISRRKRYIALQKSTS